MINLKKKCAYLNKELFLNKLSKNSWGNVSIKDKKKILFSLNLVEEIYII